MPSKNDFADPRRSARSAVKEKRRWETNRISTLAIRRWQPRYVLLVGIAGGLEKAGVAPGDLLIANQVADYGRDHFAVAFRLDPVLVTELEAADHGHAFYDIGQLRPELFL